MAAKAGRQAECWRSAHRAFHNMRCEALLSEGSFSRFGELLRWLCRACLSVGADRVNNRQSWLSGCTRAGLLHIAG